MAGLRLRDGTYLFWTAVEMPGSTSKYPLNSRRACYLKCVSFCSPPLKLSPLLAMSGIDVSVRGSRVSPKWS